MGLVAALSATAPAQALPPSELSLAQAIDFALSHSPALRGAQAEVRMSHSETNAARARLGPQIGLNGFYSQGNMGNVLQSAMGFEPQSLVLAPKDSFSDLNAMLMVPLWTGGALGGLVSAAAAREQAARFGVGAMADNPLLNTAAGYACCLN